MKTLLVTGSTDGIGRATTRALLGLGHRVVAHGRSAAKLEALQAELPNAMLETVQGDLASLRDVRRMGEELVSRFPTLNVLLFNAGVFLNDRLVSEDGYEMTLAVNHLAHFELAHTLLPCVARGAAEGHGRVVTVSSIAHSRGMIDWEDPMLDKGFTGYRAYAQSKLMNVLFANELARRAPQGVTSTSLHPGVISTKLLKTGFGMSGAPVDEGTKTSIYAALDPSLATQTNIYLSDGRVASMGANAAKPDTAARLWAMSTQWVEDALRP